MAFVSWLFFYLADLATLRKWGKVTVGYEDLRKSQRFFLSILKFPVAACLTLATFWTHPLSKSRLHLGTTNLILLVLLLLFLRSRLPMAGGQLPLIGWYCTEKENRHLP